MRDCQPVPAPERLVLRILGNCLSAPGSAPASSQQPCQLVRLIDERVNAPVTSTCSLRIDGGQRLVRMDISPEEGQVPFPQWAETVLASCPGLADTRLKKGELPESVTVPPGRPSTIKIRTVEGKPTKAKARVELKHANGKFTLAQDVTIGDTLAPGSIPLGAYAVRISSDGSATIADTFVLVPGESGLELAYTVVPGCCLPLTVSSNDLATPPTVKYELYLLSETRTPRLQDEANLGLQPAGQGRWAGKICSLPPGRYELTLRADGAVPESRVLDVQPGNPHPETFSLVRGTCSWVDVLSTDGLPIPKALAVFRWHTPEGSQRAETTTDERGRAQLPCLPAGAGIRGHILADGYVPSSVEGIAGQALLAVLKKEGAITATLTGDCAPGETDQGISVQIEWEAADHMAQGHDSVQPEKCFLLVPVTHPGNYQLRISAPDLKPILKEVALTDNLDVDLGEIELERGDPLIVKVTHDGQGVPGASVRVSRDGQSRTTDSQGVVQFAVLDDATRTVEVFVTHPEFASRRVTLGLASREREHVVALWKGGTIFGRVLNEDGLPAVGESLTAEGPENRTTTVDGQGHYEFTRLDPGPWRVVRLRMFGEGRAANTMGSGDFRAVTLQDDALVELDFVQTADVRGTVFVDGKLASQLTIGAIHGPSATGLGPTSATLQVDASGQYSSRLPMTGDWTFFLGRSTFVAHIHDCPCIVDLYFAQAAPGNPGAH